MSTPERNLDCRSSESHIEELLPGIPDEITVMLITPKLSWSDFYSLAAVMFGVV